MTNQQKEPPLRRLLLATEHTEFDSGAETLALQLAQRWSLPLAAVLPMLSNAEFEMLAPELAIKADAQTAARIQALQAAAAPLSVTLQPRVRRGANLAAEIVAEALSAGTDLLVIRRRGKRGFLSRLLVGEMVSQVVAQAPCSVLIAPRAARLWRTRVMVAVDPEAPDAACVAAAAALAADAGLPLLVVCVAAADPVLQAQAAAALATALQQANVLHADVSGMVVTGRVADALLATAEQQGADLLVVSRNRPGAGGRARMGSTTEAVSGKANGPVWAHVGAVRGPV